MQAGLSAYDRKLLWGAGVLFLGLASGAAFLSPGVEEEGAVVPSTYSSSSGGARAAYLLLQELQYPVSRWGEAPTRLAQPGNGSLLILAEPTETPSAGERAALWRFVASGGQVLFCGGSVGTFFPGADTTPRISDPAWVEYEAAMPGRLSRGAEKVVLRPAVYWKQLNADQIRLYGGPDAPAIVSWRIGSGRVLWWAGATPLTNAGISRKDNVQLLLNAVAGSRIYWDEYFHGQRGSLWSYFGNTPVPWGVLQIGAIALVALFSLGRRSGPILPSAPVSRLAPLEFVDTLGGLYQKAGAAAVAVDVASRRLRLGLIRSLRLRAGVSDVELAEAAGERLGWDHAELARLLADAGVSAQVKRLSPRRALEIVRALDRRTAQLGIQSSRQKG